MTLTTDVKETQKTESMASTNQLNILQRLHNAYKHPSLTKIKKKKMPNLGYECFVAEDVIKYCKEAIIDNGIVFHLDRDIKITHDQYDKQTKNGTKTVHYFVIQGTAIFSNIDNPADCIKVPFFGSAEDDSDKALGKGNTYAKKIAFMNVFLVQDGEDTDSDPSSEGKRIPTGPYNDEGENEDIKDIPIEIKTEDEELQSNLLQRGFKKETGYKSKEKVYKKWINPFKVTAIEESLRNRGYYLNKDKGYWESDNNL